MCVCVCVCVCIVKKTRNLEIVFHNKFILFIKAHQMDFK